MPGHLFFHLMRDFNRAICESGREEIADVGHVDPVKARSHDRRTGDPDMNFGGFSACSNLFDEDFHRCRTHDCVINEEDFFPLQNFRKRDVFHPCFRVTIFTFDECSSQRSVTHQPFEAGNAHFECHSLSGRFSCVRDRNDNRVFL